jgi:hypothetical protein
MDIFPLISYRDIFGIKKLTLILKIISQFDGKHIMTLLKEKKPISFESLDLHYH